MKCTSTLLAGILASGLAFAADVDVSKLPPAADQQGVTFEKEILPLFKASCFNCHTGARPRGGLRLDTLENVLRGGEDKVVIPGDSEKSLLVIAVARLDPKTAMPRQPQARRSNPGNRNAPGTNQPAIGGENPPGGGGGGRSQRRPQGPPPKPLTAAEVGLIRAWIEQGAK